VDGTPESRGKGAKEQNYSANLSQKFMALVLKDDGISPNIIFETLKPILSENVLFI
jgi:hypothetical protein